MSVAPGGWAKVAQALLLGGLVWACTPLPAALLTPSPQERAVAVAMQHVPSATKAVAVREGNVPDFVNDETLTVEQRDRAARAVVVDGGMEPECFRMPSGEACPSMTASTTLVIVDAATGHIYMAESPANLSVFN